MSLAHESNERARLDDLARRIPEMRERAARRARTGWNVADMVDREIEAENRRARARRVAGLG